MTGRDMVPVREMLMAYFHVLIDVFGLYGNRNFVGVIKLRIVVWERSKGKALRLGKCDCQLEDSRGRRRRAPSVDLRPVDARFSSFSSFPFHCFM